VRHAQAGKYQITNKPQIQINEIQNGLFRLLEFGFCLSVRRACAAARQADGTQTGNLIFCQKKQEIARLPCNPPDHVFRAGTVRTGTYPPVPIRAGQLRN